MNAFQCRCEVCGRATSQSYAKLHDRQCKRCYEGTKPRAVNERRNGRTAAESTSEFRGTESDLDNCPW